MEVVLGRVVIVIVSALFFYVCVARRHRYESADLPRSELVVLRALPYAGAAVLAGALLFLLVGIVDQL